MTLMYTALDKMNIYFRLIVVYYRVALHWKFTVQASIEAESFRV